MRGPKDATDVQLWADPDAGSFTIDRITAQIRTKADVPLDTETKDHLHGNRDGDGPVRADGDRHGDHHGSHGVDEAPEIMIGGLGISGMRSVRYAENGTDAVATYTAVGPESASATWSLGGDDAGDFNISSSGMLTFRSSPDYEDAGRRGHE